MPTDQQAELALLQHIALGTGQVVSEWEAPEAASRRGLLRQRGWAWVHGVARRVDWWRWAAPFTSDGGMVFGITLDGARTWSVPRRFSMPVGAVLQNDCDYIGAGGSAALGFPSLVLLLAKGSDSDRPAELRMDLATVAELASCREPRLERLCSVY